jgi:S1-C subfamily serine protease
VVRPGPGPGPSASYSTMNPPAMAEATATAPAGNLLGVETELGTDSLGQQGLKITRTYAGSVVAQAGIRIGDIIQSINGYETVQAGNIAWIIANAAPDKILRMNVRVASSGTISTFRVQLP